MLKTFINRLRGLEDYDVRAYELSTLRLIRKKSLRLKFMATGKVCLLYHSFSQINFGSTWKSNDEMVIDQFVSWIVERPIDRVYG